MRFITGNTDYKKSIEIFSENRESAIEKYEDRFGHQPSFCFFVESTQIGNIGPDIFELIHNGDLEGIKKFINNGADIEIRNNDGLTPLMLACFYRYAKIVKLLLDLGANINVTNGKSGDGKWITPSTYALYALYERNYRDFDVADQRHVKDIFDNYKQPPFMKGEDIIVDLLRSYGAK